MIKIEIIFLLITIWNFNNNSIDKRDFAIFSILIIGTSRIEQVVILQWLNK
jgi:hypothetical protein